MLRRLRRRLHRWRAARRSPPIRVALIYVPVGPFFESFQKDSLRFPYTWLSQEAQRKRAFRHFLPNSLLRSMARTGRIRLREHLLPPDSHYGKTTAGSVPPADVWVFALLTESGLDRFSEDFYAEIRRRAQTEGVQLINLASHTGSPNMSPPQTEMTVPILAKLRANGMTSPDRPESYALLTSTEEITEWQARIGPDRLGEYELHPWLDHRLNEQISPYRCIERWIWLCGDLTVGLRVSPDPIIKQLNSLTAYKRDPRRLTHEYTLLQRARWQMEPPARHGPLHLSFNYAGDPPYWDRRYALCRALQARSGFEIGTLDVMETLDGNLHLIDYNEWTYESARKDLQVLWEAALANAIHRGEDPPNPRAAEPGVKSTP